MNTADLLLTQLRLECKGLDEEGDVIRIAGDEPDDIALAQVVRLDNECRYLLSAEVPRSVRSSVREVPPEDALGHPEKVSALLGATKWESAKSFVFLREISRGEYANVHRLSPSDAALLESFTEQSFADFVTRRAVFAVVIDGRVVSACASSRENDDAAEAWVFTDPAFRGRGYATQAVAAWGSDALRQGKAAFYSRRDENVGSVNVAHKLRLHDWSAYISFE